MALEQIGAVNPRHAANKRSESEKWNKNDFQPAGCTPPRPEKPGDAGEPDTPLDKERTDMSLVCVACGAENPDIDHKDDEKAKCHSCGNYLITAKSNPTWRLGNPKVFLVVLATVFATIIISFLTYGMIPGFLLYYLVYPIFVMIGRIPQGEEAWGLMVYGTIFSSPSLLMAYVAPYIWKPRKMDLITAKVISFAIIPYSCLVVNLYLYLRR